MDQDTMGSGAPGTPSSQPQPQPSATGVKQELASDAKDIGKAARDKLDSKASEGKEQATQAARSTSSALGKAAEQLKQDEGTPDWLAGAFEKTAKEIERFAGSIEGKDMQAIRRDVGDFARRSPLTFLAVSAVAGFAAARVLRAGSDYQEHEQAGGQNSAPQMPYGSGSQPGMGSSSSQDRSSFAWADDGAQTGMSTERIGQ